MHSGIKYIIDNESTRYQRAAWIIMGVVQHIIYDIGSETNF